MHIEFRHLRTIRAIHQAGGLARAADILNITQSALSHQVKGLEGDVQAYALKGEGVFLWSLETSALGSRFIKPPTC